MRIILSMYLQNLYWDLNSNVALSWIFFSFKNEEQWWREFLLLFEVKVKNCQDNSKSICLKKKKTKKTPDDHLLNCSLSCLVVLYTKFYT